MRQPAVCVLEQRLRFTVSHSLAMRKRLIAKAAPVMQRPRSLDAFVSSCSLFHTQRKPDDKAAAEVRLSQRRRTDKFAVCILHTLWCLLSSEPCRQC